MQSHPFPESAGHPAAARRLGVESERLGYRQLARGVTHDTLIVEVDGEPAAVLRLAPPRAEILPRLQPAEEGRLFELLAGANLPIPEALIIDWDGSELGGPGLLMSYLAGANTLTWEKMRERCGERSPEHAFEVIVAMHELPIPAGWPGGEDADPLATHREREIAGVRRLSAEAGETAPSSLAAGTEALAAAPPPPVETACIVHGDFRPANLMGAEGRVTGILDWEMATTGDPACDFGVSTMREWGTWWPDEELLERYRAARGTAIDPVSLRWWRALGYAKVLSFLSCRTADGWQGPELGPWTEAFDRALAEWSD